MASLGELFHNPGVIWSDFRGARMAQSLLYRSVTTQGR